MMVRDKWGPIRKFRSKFRWKYLIVWYIVKIGGKVNVGSRRRVNMKTTERWYKILW